MTSPFARPVRRRALGLWKLGAGCAVALAGLTELSCTYHDCTDVACTTTTGAWAVITLPSSSMEGQVEVCLGVGSERTCGTSTVRWDMVEAEIQKAQMQSPSTDPSFADQPCSASDNPSFDYYCAVYTSAPPRVPQLYIDVTLPPPYPNFDGALLEIVLRADDGSTLTEAHATVHRTEVKDYNGPGCDPPLCDFATLSDTQYTGLPVTFQ